MTDSRPSDITVNVDGLWLLQGLLDIRHLAPELRCRPYVAAESAADWSDHVGMAAMREAGVVLGDGVHPQVATRMRVLAAPDFEVVALFALGALGYGVGEDAAQLAARAVPDNELRVVLARRGEHWVSAVRVGPEITVDDVTISDPGSIATLVLGVLESLHPAEPAQFSAVNVPLGDIARASEAWRDSGFDVFSGGPLRQLGLSAATVAALGQALAEPLAEAGVYVRQYRDDEQSPSPTVLSIKDGARGRLALYQQPRTAGSGQDDWLAICPGTRQMVQQGVRTLLDTVPFGPWDTHRRV